MKTKSIKFLLLLLFSLLSKSMIAQSYSFTSTNKGYQMDNYVYTNMGIYAKINFLKVYDIYSIFLLLYDTGYDVPRQISERIGTGRNLNIVIILADQTEITFNNHFVYKDKDKEHGIALNLSCEEADFKKMTTSNIEAIGIYGLNETPMIMMLPTFKSADTLKEMYKSHLSHSSSSSSNKKVFDHNKSSEKIIIPVLEGVEFSSNSKKTASFSGKPLSFIAKNQGSCYIEISVDAGNYINSIFIGTSRSMRYTYITEFDKGKLKNIINAMTNSEVSPLSYYELYSKSSYDGRRSYFGIAIFGNAIIIVKETYEENNYSKPLFSTRIFSELDLEKLEEIEEFVSYYFPKIAVKQ